MGEVSVSRDGFEVDAGVVGGAFGIPPETVREEMRAGLITSRCETGVDEDEGRWRLTFYRGGRAFRLVVDAEGAVLTRGSFPVARDRPAPRT